MKENLDLEALKFPIGPFYCPADIQEKDLEQWKTAVLELPAQLNTLVEPLTRTQLQWQYRPGGWTIKQVVHHLADSHINALARLKLTLTEDTPVIRPYEEALWAVLPDGINDELSDSLKIIEGIHKRWLFILTHLSDADWNRMYFHPQYQKLFSIKEMLGLYAWHGRHHLAHIKQAISHQGNFDI